MMVYASFEVESEFYPVGVLFESEEDFSEAAKDEAVLSVNDILRFIVRGASYQERKSALYDLAVAWSNADQSGVSYGEEAAIQDFFHANGKRYGLLREFRENAICY